MEDHPPNSEIPRELRDAITALTTTLDATVVDFFHSDACERLRRLPVPARCVVATGFYPFGLTYPGEDIHLVCVATNTRRTFWPFVHERLQLSDKVDLKKEAEEDRIELSSRDIAINCGENGACIRTLHRLSLKDKLDAKIYLHFCHLPPHYTIWHIVDGKIKMPLAAEINKPALRRAINAQQLATDARLRTPAQRSLFRTLYSRILYWAYIHGLIGPQFLFPSAATFFLLALEVAPETLEDASEGERVLADSFVHFKRLVHYRCDMSASTEDSEPSQSNSRKAISPEGELAMLQAVRLEGLDATPDRELNKSAKRAFQDFLADYPDLLLVECESWSNKLEERAVFQKKHVSDNIKRLTITFRDRNFNSPHRRFAIKTFRIWPNPRTYTPDHKYQVLLVGVGRERGPGMDEEFDQNAPDLSQWLEENILEYDRTIGHISIRLSSQEEIERMELENAMETLSQLTGADREQTEHEDSLSVSANPPPAEPKTKFRTAHSALSRVLHDPKYEGKEIAIGYSDRFEDKLKWMPLEWWVGKQTEDVDFIPEHRIRELVLWEEGESVLLWSRKRRIDLT